MAERSYKSNREDFGTLRVRSSGRIQASYVGPDGQRYNGPMTYSTKQDARGWLAGIRTDIERGQWKSPKAASAERFGTYAATWVEQRTNSKGQPLRPKTRAEYLRQLANGLAEFADDKIQQITPARVRTWHAARMRVGKTQAGAEARLLRAILNTAVEDGIVSLNPVPSKLTKSTTGKSYRVPTLEELAVLAETVEDRFRLGVLIAAYGGLRLSEWRALRRSDLQLVNGRYVVAVTRQAQYVNRIGWTVGEPKSARGVRFASLPAWMTETVDAHLAAHVGPFAESLIFAPKGPSKFIHDSDFNKTWNPAREAAGVTGQIREHDLRAFAGSHMSASAGANLIEVRDFLGHANASTTEAHYIKKVIDRSAELADAMPEIASGPRSKITKISAAKA
jgi:integrase